MRTLLPHEHSREPEAAVVARREQANRLRTDGSALSQYSRALRRDGSALCDFSRALRRRSNDLLFEYDIRLAEERAKRAA